MTVLTRTVQSVSSDEQRVDIGRGDGIEHTHPSVVKFVNQSRPRLAILGHQYFDLFRLKIDPREL